MAYSREIYEEVQNKLYKKRMNALEELKFKKEVFYKRFPRAEKIEKELSLTAIEASKAVLSGGDTAAEIEKLKEKNKVLKNELFEILKSAKLPEDYLEIKYSCEKCHDEGFIDGKMCCCMKDMLKKESYNRLNKMSPLELSSFDNFSLDYYSKNFSDDKRSPYKRMSLIYNFCRKYANDFKKNSPSLLFTGRTGLGKTHLSLAIASEVINKGFAVIYGSSQSMVSKMEKERFQHYGENDGESEKHFINCDLLIIDDLGTEFMSSFSVAAIYNIINSRIMMNKSTIISTNLTMRELEKNYTERLISRMIGNNIRLEFLGEDIRQKKLKELVNK